MSFKKVLFTFFLTLALFSIPVMAAAPAPHSDSAKKSAVANEDKLDINTASRDALMKLPGITDPYAARIIAGRPYRMKTDLVRREVLPKSVYDGIRELIIARQPKKKQ